jgi:hypothetical protein
MSEQPGAYPDAIRSFVGTVQTLAAVERERDQLRATVARVEAECAYLETLGDGDRHYAGLFRAALKDS